MSENLLGLVVGEKSPCEIELKFDISQEEATEILTQPLWRQSGHPEIKLLHSVYYDTPDRLLLRAGYSLRLREEGGKCLQTIKTLATNGASLTDRGEWSCPVRGKKPNLRARAAAIIRPVLEQMKPEDALEPIFSVAVERHALTIEFNGAQIEMALDHGTLVNGIAQRFYELELELLSGDKQTLFQLALQLFRHTPLRLNTLSKAERGFASLAGGPLPVKAGRLDLDETLTVATALQYIARACLHHLQGNIAAFRHDPTSEAIHQARVAMRRLRAVMALFRDVADDELRQPINAELRAIARELGIARALDVYIADILEPAAALYGAEPDYCRLVAEHELRRKRAYQAATDILNSPRLSYALLTIAQWVECGQWLQDAEQRQHAHSRTIVDHAAQQLSRCWKKVRREAKRRQGHTDEQRHAWRIEIKKLRYACEFFSSLFEPTRISDDGSVRAGRKVLRRLSSLQDALGELNDIAEASGKNPLSEIAAKLHRVRAEKRPLLAQNIDHDIAVLRKTMRFWKPAKSSTGGNQRQST